MKSDTASLVTPCMGCGPAATTEAQHNMSKAMDDFVEEIKNQVLEETREVYGNAAFERWLDPRLMGSLDDPDGYACLRGKCGDTVQIYLKFDGDRVKEATFQTDGCGSSIVCASFAAEMALAKRPDEILEITGESIMDVLGGLPKEEAHCAFLAAETLQEALHSYMIRSREETGQ